MQELVELTGAELDMVCGGQSTVAFRLNQTLAADVAGGLNFTQEIALDGTFED